MPICKEAESLIKNSEGFRLEAYLCPANVWTIGWGSTEIDGKPVKKGLKITEKKAQEQFDKDVEYRVKAVLGMVKKPLNENQLGALVSLAYNIGLWAGGFQTSTLLRQLNLGNYQNAADQFLRWNKATVNGKLVVLAGLVTRRAKERALFLKPSEQ